MITERINDLILEKEEMTQKDILKNKIIKELLYLGYDMSHKGTEYLADCINYVVTNNYKYFENLEKEIYPIIAQKYNANVRNIKSNIIRANNEMYCECEVEKLKNYFNFSKDHKPKIKVVIKTILNKIL